MAGAEAEEEEQEVEDEDSDHGIFSSFTAAAGCGIVRGPLCDGLVSSRRSARADGIAPRPRFRSSLPLDVGFWGFAVFVRRARDFPVILWSLTVRGHESRSTTPSTAACARADA